MRTRPWPLALALAGCNLVFPVHVKGGFCASLDPQPTSCDDFDEGQELGPGWGVQADPGSSYGLDSSTSASSPASLRMSSNGATQLVGASRQVHASTSITLAFDLLASTLGSDAYGSLGGIVVNDNAPNQNKAILFVKSGDTRFAEQSYDDKENYIGEDPSVSLQIAPDPTRWVHYELTIDVSANPAKATVVVDGARRTFDLKGDWRASVYAIGLGMRGLNGSTQRWSIAYDNVVVDAK